mmetsp:Transcript_41477/g.115270  ORF Transcript_41477/g.115270 Transcript_41477/m.115270 type:complete len:217 (+) Transcript_41477:389-1039(+)
MRTSSSGGLATRTGSVGATAAAGAGLSTASGDAALPQRAAWTCSAALRAFSGSSHVLSVPPVAALSSMPFRHRSMCCSSPPKMRCRSSSVTLPSWCMNLRKSSGLRSCSSCSCCRCRFSICLRAASAPDSICIRNDSIELPSSASPGWVSFLTAGVSAPFIASAKALADSGACLASCCTKSRCTSGLAFWMACNTSSLALLSAVASPLARPTDSRW